LTVSCIINTHKRKKHQRTTADEQASKAEQANEAKQNNAGNQTGSCAVLDIGMDIGMAGMQNGWILACQACKMAG